MTDIIRANSTILSWNSFAFKIDGIPYNGIRGFDYEQKRERTVVHGARRDGRPLGKTSGKYSVPTCTLTCLRDTADKITTYLQAKGLGSYGDAEFTFFAQYIEPVLGATPITVVGTGCTIDGEKDTNQEGTEAVLTEFEIGCLEIIKNGKSLASLRRALSV
jgi:hypothetical protein